MINSGFNNIGLIGRYRGNFNLETLEDIIHFLQSKKINVILEQETAQALNETRFPIVSRDQLSLHSDLIIVVGGDGSLLGAARFAINHNVPVLGVNRGSLGFLTDIRPDEVKTRIGEVLKGHYTEEKRFLLTASIHHDNQLIAHNDALNDVVLMPGDIPHMIAFDVYINEQFMCSHKADGIIVATPTGSTAYALSGGGPILHPQLDALALVPVFPHKLSSRPIVVNGDSVIKIIINAHNESAPRVSCDSQDRISVPPGGHIRIVKKSQKLRLIHPIGYNYFETLRSKLGWETALL
ncbi:MAG: NAD(+) kinase [Legionellales bacterium]|nr:NAD(+) kinase [Legionellales bacterium]